MIPARDMALIRRAVMAQLLLLLSLGCVSCTRTTSSISVFDFVKAAGGGGTVKVGVDAHGIRGLVAGCDAQVGDVLLEVPLTVCLADCRGPDVTAEEPLPGDAPSWCSSLPWNVALAANILTRQGDECRRGAVQTRMRSGVTRCP